MPDTRTLSWTAPMVLAALFAVSPPARSDDCSADQIEAFGTEFSSQISCLAPEDASKLAEGFKKIVPVGPNGPDPAKMLDFMAGVADIAMPGAGAALGVAKMALGMLGVFDQPDPMQLLNNRITALEQQLGEVSNKVMALERELRLDVNTLKQNDLIPANAVVNRCVAQLRQVGPLGTSKTNIDLVRGCRAELQTHARFFLEAQNWRWSEYRLKFNSKSGGYDGYRMPARFSPYPTLPYYSATVAGWLHALQLETGGHGPSSLPPDARAALQAHLKFLKESLSPQIGEMVRCEVKLVAAYPTDGQCRVQDVCYDLRTNDRSVFPRPQDSFPPVANSGGRCDYQFIPTAAQFEPRAEVRLEEQYGTEVVQQMSTLLTRMLTTGSLVEAVQRFPCQSATEQFLYAVQPNGELTWRAHEIIEECQGETRPWERPGTTTVSRPQPAASPGVVGAPASRPGSQPTQFEHKRTTQATAAAQTRDTAAAAPEMTVIRAIASDSPVRISQRMRAARSLGGNWLAFRRLLPAGFASSGPRRTAFVFYGLTPDGQLRWFRHDDPLGGAPTLSGPVELRAPWNWNSYRTLIAAGDGVIYGITADGSLVWHRHADPGSSAAAWLGPRIVATGFGNYRQVFSGGEGVLYAVDSRGMLIWNRHLGFHDGAATWATSTRIDSGWGSFTAAFSPGEGHVYALQASGQLLWARHLGWKTGENSWRTAVPVAQGLRGMPQIFPLMWGERDPGLRVH